jgi:fatty acid desaturase
MSEERFDWYRTRIDRDTLRELTERSDGPGLAQALSHLALFAATSCGAWYAWTHLHWAWFALALFVHGTFAQFLGIGAACHELSHGTPFKSKRLALFFYNIFSFISWNNPVWFRVSHFEHHKYTLHAPHDGEVVLPMIRSTWNVVCAIFVNPTQSWMSLKRHVQHAFGVVATPWEKKIFDAAGPQKRAELVMWARILVLGHLALGIWFVLVGQWILIPILLFPVYAGWLCDLVGQSQHIGLQSNVTDFRRCCRTVVLDPFCAFLYWQMNYHVEHHMYPAVPFYKLRKLHTLLQADGAPPPNRGLLDSLREIRMIQRQQRKTPGVAYDSFSRGKQPVYVPQEG